MSGKGDKIRPHDKRKYDQNYDQIFGDKDKKQRKGTFIWDETEQRFVHEDEYIAPRNTTIEAPHFHIVGGTEATRWEAKRRHMKGLKKDPFYTTLPEKQDKVQDFKDRKQENLANLRDEVDPKTRKTIDKAFELNKEI